MSAGTGRRRRRRAGTVATTVAALLAVAGATAVASGIGLPRGKADAGTGRTDRPATTATVTRQTLLDTQKEFGELGYGESTALSGRLSGTLTWLPATGSVIRRGQPVYRVDNTPVVLLYGGLPAYRQLRAGTEGADVEQFEQNLAALGYRGFTVDETYSASTATAVRQWQEDLGLPETGVVDLGRVVFAPGEIRVDALQAAAGDSSQPGKTLLDHTGTEQVVSVELDMSDQRLAVDGGAVNVKLPNGKTSAGKITKVTTVVEPAEGQQQAETKIDVTVAITDRAALTGLGQASVEVTFTASRRENVLTVPVAALLALAEGGYGVQVVDGTNARIVAVQTGLFASGRVEVTGDGLAEGTTVGMPS